MNVMRYTIIDSEGGVSFVDDCDVLSALVAACAQNPRGLGEMLEVAEGYYRTLKDYVLNGLAIFDEHNVPGRYEAIHSALLHLRPEKTPVFRVVDDLTREASLQPVKAGIIIFNLPSKRIVQVMNSYAEIQREGRGNVHDGGRPTGRVFSYRLPKDWMLVP